MRTNIDQAISNLRAIVSLNDNEYIDEIARATADLLSNALEALRTIDDLASRGIFVIIDNDSSKGARWDVTFEQGSVDYSDNDQSLAQAIHKAAGKVPA